MHPPPGSEAVTTSAVDTHTRISVRTHTRAHTHTLASQWRAEQGGNASGPSRGGWPLGTPWVWSCTALSTAVVTGQRKSRPVLCGGESEGGCPNARMAHRLTGSTVFPNDNRVRLPADSASTTLSRDHHPVP